MTLDPARRRQLLVDAAMAMAARRIQYPHDAKRAEDSFVETARDYASDAAGVPTWASDGLKAIGNAVGLPLVALGDYIAPSTTPGLNHYAADMRAKLGPIVSAVAKAAADARRVPQFEATIKRLLRDVERVSRESAAARQQLEVVSKERDDLAAGRDKAKALAGEIESTIEALTGENTRLASERDVLLSRLDDLQARLDRLAYKETRASLIAKIADLERNLNDATRNLAGARDALRTQAKEYDERVAKMEQRAGTTEMHDISHIATVTRERDEALARLGKIEPLLGQALAIVVGPEAKVNVIRHGSAPAPTPEQVASMTSRSTFHGDRQVVRVGPPPGVPLFPMTPAKPGVFGLGPKCSGWPCMDAACRNAGRCKRG